MRRALILATAALAVWACCAAFASSALASGEWIAGGKAITEALSAASTGLLFLVDLVLGTPVVKIDCSMTWDGTVGPGAADLVTAVLNAAGEEISKTPLAGLALLCEVVTSTFSECGAVGSLAEVWPLNLPWATEIEIMTGSRALDRLPASGGWEILCSNGKENLCEGKTSAELKNLGTGVLSSFGTTAESESVTCTVGVGDLEGEMTTTLNNGEVLNVAGAAPPAPRLDYVDFSGNSAVLVDHENNTAGEGPFAITSIGGDSIDWKSPKVGEVTKNWPVLYANAETIKLETRVAVEAATEAFLENLLEGNAKLTGKVTLDGVAMTFEQEFTKEELKTQFTAHKGFVLTNVIAASKALSAKVKLYEGAAIAWEWSAKEKGAANPFVQALGNSTHNIYTAYAKALTGENFFTLLDVDTKGVEKAAKQPPSEAESVAGVWEEFAKVEAEVPSIRIRTYNRATGAIGRGANTVLRYYGNVAAGKSLEELYKNELRGACGLFTVEQLLKEFEGRCGAWEDMLANALATEGIGSELVHLFSQFGLAGEICAAENVCVMLVKKWKLENNMGGEFPFPAANSLDEEGVAGQGVLNPPPFFWDHAILRAGPAGAGALYDPSYGAGPFTGLEGLEPGEEPTELSVLLEYQKLSIDGYCRPAEGGEYLEPTLCLQTGAQLDLTPSKAFLFP